MISKSREDTHAFAESVLAKLAPKADVGASVLALHGELGAGKTAFVQELASILGVKEKVQSPTFVILKNYSLEKGNYTNLIHIDAYRLDRGEDLQKLNWDMYVNNHHNLIVIEWAERIESILPKDTLHIDFEHMSETERNIELRR